MHVVDHYKLDAVSVLCLKFSPRKFHSLNSCCLQSSIHKFWFGLLSLILATEFGLKITEAQASEKETM